jgi:hypothetical protein
MSAFVILRYIGRILDRDSIRNYHDRCYAG